MKKTDREYWKQRALLREKVVHAETADTKKKIYKHYNDSMNDINDKIEEFYYRYAKENGITYLKAKEILTDKQYDKWEKSLKGYIEEIEQATNAETASALKAQLDARTYKSRISRLDALKGEIETRINVMYFKALNCMKESFSKVVSDTYMNSVNDLASRFKLNLNPIYLSSEVIEDILIYPWCGNHFSDRLWKNKETLIYNIRDILAKGVTQGTSLPQMAKQLSDKMRQSFKAAYNLVESETTHFFEEGSFRAYETAGIKKYQFIAEHELTVCKTCASLDNKIFYVSERKEGKNAPPMHNHCRCITSL